MTHPLVQRVLDIAAPGQTNQQRTAKVNLLRDDLAPLTEAECYAVVNIVQQAEVEEALREWKIEETYEHEQLLMWVKAAYQRQYGGDGDLPT